MSLDHQLKLVSRGSKGKGEFFDEPVSAYFGNHVKDVLDEVSVFITPSELKCLVDLLDWSQVGSEPAITHFLGRLKSSYDGRSVRTPYFDALLAIKDLARVAVQQAKHIEDLARDIESSDLTLKEQPADSNGQEEPKSLNFIDANKLLSVIVGLEDQVYQIASQSECLSTEAKKVLYQRDMSRAHTALGRLASLMSLPSDQQHCPLALADHGVCNVRDKSLSEGLRFYQHLKVDLSNIYEACSATGSRDIHAVLEEQFKSNLMIKGFDSWNVPLAKSINSMPSRAHWSGLQGQSSRPPITGL